MKKGILFGLLALPALAAPAPAAEPDGAALVKGNTAFALDLFGRLRAKEGNLFFSPYSISSALAMTSAGARGETLAEMEAALHFPPQERLHPAFAALMKDMNDAGQGKKAFQLSTVNRLWGQKDYQFLPAFTDLTQKHYGAGLQEVDFARATEVARKTINAWVEKETRDRIKELLRPGVVTADTRLVLTNAIYFKADWQSQFKKDRTQPGAFAFPDGKELKVPFMHQTARLPYAETDDAQVLGLPYFGGTTRMVVLLPKKADGLAALEKGLTAATFTAALDKMTAHQVEVALPKFKFTAQFSLVPELKALGMKKAFGHGADLSGLTGSPGLFITDVVHKAFVDVDEEGTEAAAATAVVVGKNGLPREVKSFRADRPFLFAITDAKTGNVLFLGRVTDPSK